MEQFDPGPLERIKASIEGSLAVQGTVTAADALVEAANRYRSAIPAILPESVTAEFRALFPGPDLRVPSEILEQAKAASKAREQLSGMVGWLDSLIKTYSR